MELGSLELTEIIGGVVAIVVSYAYARKKFSFDNLEIAKSNTERELIDLLREQIKTFNDDLIKIKTKYNELEEKTKIIGKERDEAIQENLISKDDIKRYMDKIKNLEEIINRLTDALEVTSEKLNDALNDEN